MLRDKHRIFRAQFADCLKPLVRVQRIRGEHRSIRMCSKPVPAVFRNKYRHIEVEKHSYFSVSPFELYLIRANNLITHIPAADSQKSAYQQK